MRRTSVPARQRLRGDSEYGEAKNAISRCDVSHARSNLPNDTSHFIAKNSRVRRIARIKRERLEHVAEIHSRRFHFDQHLAGTTRRQLKRSKTKGIKMPTLTGLETQRQRGIKPLLARGPAAIQSLGIARFAAEGDLALRGFAEQLAPKQRHVRGGGFEGKIDAAEEKFGVFVRDDAHQSDGRRLADGVREQVASDRLGTAGHEIEAQFGRGTVSFERLREMKQRVQIAGHGPVIDARIEIPKIDDALRHLFRTRFH